MAEREAALFSHSELQRIREIQDQALEWIEALEPDHAITLLNQVNQEVEQRQATLEWARQSLLFAKAYAAKNHEVAEHFFGLAVERMRALPGRDLHFSLLVHKSLGRYLFGKRRFRAARKQYEVAEQQAMALGASEELAQMQLRIIEAGYRLANDIKQQRHFELFKKVAHDRHCTFEHQHRAWMRHEQALEGTAMESLFMRSSRALDATYFEQLLDSTSANGHEDEEESKE